MAIDILAILAEIDKVKKVVTLVANIVKRHGSKVDEEKEPVKFSESGRDLTFDELLEEAEKSLAEKQ